MRLKNKIIRSVFVLFIISLLFVTPMAAFSADTSAMKDVESKNIFTSSAINEPSASPEGMTFIAKKGYLALFLNKTNGEFAIEDLRDNHIWYSNPVDKDQDTVAQGSAKNELSSQLVVTDIDTQKNIVKSRNSLIGCLNKNGLTVNVKNDGFEALYNFPEYKYTIPITYTLLEDSIKVSIDTSKIVETGNLKVFTVGILPVFGAQNSEQTGYILLPDGSGSVIDFNNGRGSYSIYRSTIYGRDMIFKTHTRTNISQNITIPVYGIQSGDHGMVSIIEQGASMANVNARVSGQMSNYNSAYFDFDVRSSQTAILGIGTNQKSVLIYEEQSLDVGPISVRYFPTTKEKAGYAGMASVVREYLIKQYDMKAFVPNEATLYINTVGSARKKTSVLGFRRDVTIPITTFDTMGEMMKELNSLGVDRMAVSYSAWSDSEIRGKIITSSDYVGKLGGKKGINELITTANSMDSKIYLNSEFMYYSKSGNGVSKYWDCSKDINLSSVEIDTFKANTFYPDPNIPTRRLVNIFKFPNDISNLVSKLNKNSSGIGMGIGSLGNTQYSNYSIEHQKKAFQELLVQQKLAAQSGNINMIGSNPFMYALAYMSEVTNIPDSSSNYDVISRSIPFVQMVLRGLIPYSTTPVNNSGSPDQKFLYCIESGSMLNYNLIGINPSEIKDTGVNDYYSANYSYWKDIIADQYSKIADIYSQTKGAHISEYIIVQDGVVKTVYDNGVYTIVNYNSTDVDIDGTTVKANDFVLKGGK